MAQTTSELWRKLYEAKNTEREYAHEINGVWYGDGAEVASSVKNELFETFGIGRATSAQLSLEILADDIPKGAEIKRCVRLVNGAEVSEWLPKGTFYAASRDEDDGYWTIEAFDAMTKANAKYLPDEINDTWPKPMPDVVAEIAANIGVEIDSRTVINPAYMLQMPIGYTQREILAHIAAAHGGNFIISDAGALLLVPLLSAPAETSYLINEHGSAIVVGGVRIVV